MQIHITPWHFRLSANLHQTVAAQALTWQDAGIDILVAQFILIQEATAGHSGRLTAYLHALLMPPNLPSKVKVRDMYLAREQAALKVSRQWHERKNGLRVGRGPRIGGGAKTRGTSVGPNRGEQKDL